MIINWIEVRDPDPEQEYPYVKKYYDLAHLFEVIKTAGYAVTWHQVLNDTILGGTSVAKTKDCLVYQDSFTVTQNEEGYLVSIHGQVTKDQKVSTEEEVLGLLEPLRSSALLR